MDILAENIKLMKSNNGYTKVLAMNMLGKVLKDKSMTDQSIELANKLPFWYNRLPFMSNFDFVIN